MLEEGGLETIDFHSFMQYNIHNLTVFFSYVPTKDIPLLACEEEVWYIFCELTVLYNDGCCHRAITYIQ